MLIILGATEQLFETRRPQMAPCDKPESHLYRAMVEQIKHGWFFEYNILGLIASKPPGRKLPHSIYKLQTGTELTQFSEQVIQV